MHPCALKPLLIAIAIWINADSRSCMQVYRLEFVSAAVLEYKHIQYRIC